MLRHDPRIIFLKSKIENKLNKVKYANFFLQTFMPEWHPWENYHKSYASNKALGGGVLLTCSHEIDLSVFWKIKPEFICIDHIFVLNYLNFCMKVIVF